MKNGEYSEFDFKTSHYRPEEALRAPEAGDFHNF
jgi:hypothetical protein